MKTAMIFGTFDVVHHGHLSLFRQAKKYANRLIVVVARDTRVKSLKRLPIYDEKDRKFFLEQIKLIDKVILGDKIDVYKTIKKFQPEVIVLGYDQRLFTDKLADKIVKFGLKTRIVRAKAYRAKNLKTKKIRKRLEKEI